MADPVTIDAETQSKQEHAERRKLRRHRAATIFRTIIFLLLFGLIIYTWYSSFMHSGGRARSEFAWYVVAVAALLVALFFLEALEIAYTLLRDKLLDQFPSSADRDFFLGMRKHEYVVYEAREWLVIIIIAAITLIAEFGSAGGLFIGHYAIKPQFLFPIVFASLPVIWFAQGPGKELARSLPRRVLFGFIGRITWPCVRAVSYVVEWTGLNVPAKLVPWCLRKTSREINPPSDEEFFLQSVYRYGFALHNLLIQIHILPDGACKVRQSFVIYLLRYPRSDFRREVFFDSKVVESQFLHVEGYYQCPVLQDSYETVCQVLEQIREGKSKLDVTERKKLGFTEREKVGSCESKVDPERPGHVRFEISTHQLLPKGKWAAAIAVVCEGHWAAGAMKIQHGETDYFQQSFRYPCRNYRLELVPDPSLDFDFSKIEASATFMNNLHKGETDRLEFAREDDNERIISTLTYPLPGAEYRYSWHVVRRKQA